MPTRVGLLNWHEEEGLPPSFHFFFSHSTSILLTQYITNVHACMHACLHELMRQDRLTKLLKSIVGWLGHESIISLLTCLPNGDWTKGAAGWSCLLAFFHELDQGLFFFFFVFFRYNIRPLIRPSVSVCMDLLSSSFFDYWQREREWAAVYSLPSQLLSQRTTTNSLPSFIVPCSLRELCCLSTLALQDKPAGQEDRGSSFPPSFKSQERERERESEREREREREEKERRRQAPSCSDLPKRHRRRKIVEVMCVRINLRDVLVGMYVYLPTL